MPEPATLLLKFDPESELHFKGPYAPRASITKLNLKNIDPKGQVIMFKIKTTMPKYYTVVPTHGFVSPDSDVTVYLTLNGVQDDLLATKNKHKFLVQAIAITKEQQSQGPADRLFRELSKDAKIYENKLKVIFDSLPETDAELSTSSSSGHPPAFRSMLRPDSGGAKPPLLKSKSFLVVICILVALIACALPMFWGHRKCQVSNNGTHIVTSDKCLMKWNYNRKSLTYYGTILISLLALVTVSVVVYKKYSKKPSK